ncbi:hypothetical protein ACHQM5_018102 [Ranunculus cassubicifolius]
MNKPIFLLLFFFLVLSTKYSASGFVPVFDGLNVGDHNSSNLLLNTMTSSGICAPMYGFLPCAVNIWGHLFLIIVYQYFLYLGEKCVSNGSELMFHALGNGVFGASAFQILGSFPQAILVLASGISGSKEAAQAQLMGGVGILAGSTVFLLTLLFGTCVVVGKVDLPASPQSFDTEALIPSRLRGSGITTDIETRYTARIMIFSTIPFIVTQLPHVLGSSPGSVATLIALIISSAFLLVYCLYQVFHPWIQNKRLEYLKHKFVDEVVLQKLLNRDGEPNKEAMSDLFRTLDLDEDKLVTSGELQGLMLGIQFQKVFLYADDFLDVVMEDFDVSCDDSINEDEFVKGFSKWISDRKKLNESFEVTEGSCNRGSSFWTYLKSAFLLLVGTAILVVLATPLIKTVINFSSAANIPPMYISFIVIPVVVNFRRAISAFTFIRKKRQQSASLTLSMIYGAAYMNNIVGGTIFFGIAYARGLVWDFSAEVLILLLVSVVMGLYSGICKTYTLWTSFMAYLMYLFALMLIYVLTNLYGWI